MEEIELYVSAARYNEDRYLAIIDDSDDHSIRVAVADTPQQACLSAAAHLREVAERFEALAKESNPIHCDAHEKVNGQGGEHG